VLPLCAVVLLFALPAAHALSDEELCKQTGNWLEQDELHWWVPDRNERLIGIVRDLGRSELPAQGILICSGEGWLGNTILSFAHFNEVTSLEERRGIAIHRRFLRDAPGDILRLAVIHEIGHFVCGHAKQACSGPCDDEVATQCEREADDAAAAIAGPCEIARMLSWMVDYYERNGVFVFQRALLSRAERQRRVGNCPDLRVPPPRSR
jgi:hypothetical protein